MHHVPPNKRSLPARCLVAMAIFAVCLGIRFLLLPVEQGLAFLTFYPGTAIAALLCGLAPTLLYVLVAGTVGSYIFLPPYWSFEQFSYVPVVEFFVAATTILLVIDLFQRRVAQQTASLIEENDAKQALVLALQERSQELVATHSALVRREAELADAQRIAKIGSWHWDARTDATIASPEMCRIFGRSDVPPFAEQDGVMFPRHAWLELHKARQEVIQTGVGYSLELPAIHADGSHLWVNSRSEAERDGDGNIIGLRGVVQDISERKQAESIAKSERFIRTITNAMPGLVAYYDKDACCRFANKAYLDWHGKSAEAMNGATLREVLGESLFAINEPHIRGVLAGQTQHFERFLTRPDGSVGHVLANYIPDVDAFGEIVGFILLVTDIKALKLAEAEREMAANVVENTVEGIMVTDIDGTILSVNPAFTRITGYPAEEAIGQTPRLLRSSHHDEAFHAALWRQIADEGQWKGEVWNRRKNGEIFLAWQTITRIGDKDKPSSRYMSVFHDTTDAWRQRELTRHLAFHDALTGLPNRVLLLERLERQIVMTERQPRRLALLFVDLDGFKTLNDTLGHAVGDEMLIAVAKRLQALLRQTDTVARLGGDEFVVILDNPADQHEVAEIANRIIVVINEPLEVDFKLATVGASIGIATFPTDGTSASELLKSADKSMYQAKQAGRNTYCFSMPEVAGGHADASTPSEASNRQSKNSASQWQ